MCRCQQSRVHQKASYPEQVAFQFYSSVDCTISHADDNPCEISRTNVSKLTSLGPGKLLASLMMTYLI